MTAGASLMDARISIYFFSMGSPGRECRRCHVDIGESMLVRCPQRHTIVCRECLLRAASSNTEKRQKCAKGRAKNIAGTADGCNRVTNRRTRARDATSSHGDLGVPPQLPAGVGTQRLSRVTTQLRGGHTTTTLGYHPNSGRGGHPTTISGDHPTPAGVGTRRRPWGTTPTPAGVGTRRLSRVTTQLRPGWAPDDDLG
jgi:hypothetical protein